MRLKDDQLLFIRSMGKNLRVTAIFHADDEANAYMQRHSGEAVIAVVEPYVFLADVHDRGVA